MKQLVCLALIIIIITAGCRKAPAGSGSQADGAGKSAAASNAQATGSTTSPVPPPQGPPATSPVTGPTAARAAVKPVPAQLPAIVARVNGEAIDKANFERAIRNLEAGAGQKVPVDRRNTVYRGVLDELVAFELLAQEAAARGLKVGEKEVDTQIAGLRQRFKTEDEFKTALASRGMSLSDLKVDARRQLLIERVLRAEVEPKVSVSDQDVQTFYKQNPQQFQRPERVRASHILIRADEKAGAAQRQAARAKTDDLLQQVQRGADFAALAREHSQDGSAANGGDLGFFARGQMVKPFEDAAFALKPGQVSGVVETPFGFHLIKMASHESGATVPLDEVRARVAEYLKQAKRQELSVQFVRTLRAKGSVEILI